MPTTTIRLSEELKAHISSAAERAGSTTHRFILEAIADKTEQTERMAEFHDEAFQRYEKMIDSGKAFTVEHDERIFDGESRRRITPSTESQKAFLITMTVIELAPEIHEEFDRILDHLFDHEANDLVA